MDSDPFVVRMNIAHFRALLQTEMDEAKRRIIAQLLAEVEAANMLFQEHAPPAQRR